MSPPRTPPAPPLTHPPRTGPTSTPAHRRLLVRGAVLPLERAHLQEVDVRGGLLRPTRVVGLDRPRVVSDELARLEPRLLEEDRVAAPPLLARATAGLKRDSLLGPAVHLIDQLQPRHPILVSPPVLRLQLFH